MLQQNGGAAGTFTAWATAITAVVAVVGVAVAFAVLRIEQARRRDEQADRAERHDQQRPAQLRVQWQRGFVDVTNRGHADAYDVTLLLRSTAPGNEPLSLLEQPGGHGAQSSRPDLAAGDSWDLPLVDGVEPPEAMVAEVRWYDGQPRQRRTHRQTLTRLGGPD
jgi:hypothetical protein